MLRTGKPRPGGDNDGFASVKAPVASESLIGLDEVVDIAQQPALLLRIAIDQSRSAGATYHAEHLNPQAARMLGVDASVLPGPDLRHVMREETAAAFAQLCAEARTTVLVNYFATAPDPLTDLSGTAAVSIRIVHVGEFLLCTWIPGPSADAFDGDRHAGSDLSIADHVELGRTLATVQGTGIGVFSMNLMTGRIIWSQGMYEIFGGQPTDGPMDAVAVLSRVEFAPPLRHAWQLLIRDGVPLDRRFRLAKRAGGHDVHVTAHAFHGLDGFPTVVRGSCRVVAN